MRRICAVITSRASYARIRTALEALRDRSELHVILAGAAVLDRYGSVEPVGLGKVERLSVLVSGGTPAAMSKTTGLLTVELASAFERIKPDLVITVADRHETLATATAAAYQNIRLLHVQGGEQSGSIDDKVRNAVTMLADVHCVATKQAAVNVHRMGAGEVHVTGCPSIDLAARVKGLPLDFEPAGRYGGVGADVDFSGRRLVVLQHPVTTTWDATEEAFVETLEAVDRIGLPTAWFWPNPDAGTDTAAHVLRQWREQGRAKTVRFFKHFAAEDFLRFIQGSVLVGNSSTGIREASFLGVPVVNVGSRQDGRERGPNVIDVPHDRDEIEAAIRGQLLRHSYPSSDLYGNGRAGEAIAEVASRLTWAVQLRQTA